MSAALRLGGGGDRWGRIVAGLALLVGASASAAEPIDHLGDGAAVYGRLRPAPLGALLTRLGADGLDGVPQLRERLGQSPFDPALLGPTGIAADGAVAVALFEVVQERGGYFHHRLVLPLADAPRARLFLDGMAGARGALTLVAPGSPLGRLGVVATAALPEEGLALLRLTGDLAIVDLAQPYAGRLPAAAALAHRFPVVAKSPWSRGAVAQRVLAAPGAALAFVDGKRLAELMLPLRLAELRFPGPDAGSPKQRAAARQAAAACGREWARLAAPLDDLTVTVDGDSDRFTLRLAWGGALGLTTADDAGLDLERLEGEALGTVSLPWSSLTPLVALRRPGAAPRFAELDPFLAEAGRCGSLAWSQILVRHWPQLLTMALDGVGRLTPPAGTLLLGLVGRLRNLQLVLRELPPKGPRFAAAATFDPGARPVLELLGAAAAATPFTVGERQAQLYPLAHEGSAGTVVALEALGGERLLVAVADSADTLRWSLAPRPRPGERPPLGRLRLDGPRLARRLAAQLPGPLLPLLARGGPIEGLLTDGDGRVHLTLFAPLPKP